MRLLVDASVVVTWLVADPEREKHTELATTFMSAIVQQTVPAVQPVHWVGEVGSVLFATVCNALHLNAESDVPSPTTSQALRRAWYERRPGRHSPLRTSRLDGFAHW